MSKNTLSGSVHILSGVVDPTITIQKPAPNTRNMLNFKGCEFRDLKCSCMEPVLLYGLEKIMALISTA